MKLSFPTVLLAGTILSSQVLAAPPVEQPAVTAPSETQAPAPDLTIASINRAVFTDWETRLKADAEREKAAAEAEAEAKDAGSGSPEASTGGEPAASQTQMEGAADATTQSAEAAEDGGERKPDLPDPFLIRMQVLLDRAHASPGVIDGLDGGNTGKAIRAYEAMRDLKVDGKPDADFWNALAADQGEAMMTYQITAEDLKQPFVAHLPTDYGELAKLKWLGYRDPAEMFAERFHMDEDLLRMLNPGSDFKVAGATILVASTGAEAQAKVARIIVDKNKGELFAYDKDGKLVLSDPATIGSSDTPSPSGVVKVNGSAPNPTYAYNPDRNFKQGKNSEKLTIPAGPNGPVGDIWIDLSKPTYGIHGTPEPSKIDKTASHGCVRLTNWDARALSKLVQPGRTVVEFKG